MSRRFREYNSHHFFNKWGILGNETGRDEEWWVPDPPVLSDDHPSYLCEMCRHIDFGVLFTKCGLPGNSSPGPTKIKLHSFDRILKWERCSFCRMITSRAAADKIIDLCDEEGIRFVDIQLNVIDEGEQHAIRLEIELIHLLGKLATQRYVIRHFDKNNPKSFNAYPIEKGKACSIMLRSWLQRCEDSHSASQGVRPQNQK